MVRNAPRFVSYCRVSTKMQGASGLGLEAQQAAVTRHVTSVGGRIVAEFVEVESGRNDDRPQLKAALAACKRHRAVLLVAKLDRLARNAAFLLNLRDAGVEFVAADMPAASRLTVGIMALVAEEEARAISERTKLALAEAKKRGVKIGGHRANSCDVRPYAKQGGAASGVARREKAEASAANLAPMIEEIRAAGATTLCEIAAGLNEQGIRTARGGEWSAMQVSRVLARMEAVQ